MGLLNEIASDSLYREATEEQRDKVLTDFIDSRLSDLLPKIPPDVMEAVRVAVKQKYNPPTELLGGPKATISAPPTPTQRVMNTVKPLLPVVDAMTRAEPFGLGASVLPGLAATGIVQSGIDEYKTFKRTGQIRKAMGSPRDPIESTMEGGLRLAGLGGVVDRFNSPEPQGVGSMLLNLANLTGSAAGLAWLTGSAARLARARGIIKAAKALPSLSEAEANAVRLIHESVTRAMPETPPRPSAQGTPNIRTFPAEGSPTGMPSLERRLPIQEEPYTGPERRGPGNFNFNRFENPETKILLMDFYRNPIYRKRLYEAKRGRMSVEAIQQLAQEYKLDEKQILELQKGTVLPAEGVVKAGMILEGSKSGLSLLADKLEEANRTKNVALDGSTIHDAQQLLAHFLDVAEKVHAIGSEHGRALRALQIRIKNLSAEGKMLYNFAMREGQNIVTPEKAREILELVSRLKNNPGQISYAILKEMEPTWLDKALEFSTGAKLLSPLTWVKNGLGNLIMSQMRMGMKAAQGPFDMLYSKATGTPRHVYSSEAKGYALGLRAALGDAVTIFLQNFREQVPSSGKFAEGENIRVPAIQNAAGPWIRLGFRVLQATDEAAKTLFRRAELYSLAYRQAEYEGLVGMARVKRIEDLVRNPPRKWLKTIEDYTLETAFQEPLGLLGQTADRLRTMLGGAPKFQVPFFRTPVNIFKTLARGLPITGEISLLTPPLKNFKGGKNFDLIKGIRAAKTLKQGPSPTETLEQLQKGERIAGVKAVEAMTRLAMGHLMAGFTIWLAHEGYITGAGPKNPTERAMLMNTGWRPYSVHIGDTYMPISKILDLDPISSILKFSGDIGEAMAKYGTIPKSQTITSMGTALMKVIMQQPYLSGVADFYDAARDPERKFGVWLDRMVASQVPAPVRQVARAIDPYERKPENPIQAVMAAVPGLSKKVPPRLDSFGRPIKSDDYLLWRSSPVTDDFVDKELNRLYQSVGFGFAPRSDRFGNRKLTQEEAQEIARFQGDLLREGARKVMSQRRYLKADDDLRKYLLEGVKQDAVKQVSERYKAKVELRTLGLLEMVQQFPPKHQRVLMERLIGVMSDPKYDNRKDPERTRMLLERIKKYVESHPNMTGGQSE